MNLGSEPSLTVGLMPRRIISPRCGLMTLSYVCPGPLAQAFTLRAFGASTIQATQVEFTIPSLPLRVLTRGWHQALRCYALQN